MKASKAAPKKTAAAASKSSVPASATKAKGTGDKEVDEVIKAMSGMALSNQREWGFDFSGPCPFFWWTYTCNNEIHCKMEILMSQVSHEEVRASVASSGECLLVHVGLPKAFLNIGRLFGCCQDPATNLPAFAEESAMFAQGDIAIREIKAKMELMGGAKTVPHIKLPFKVLSNFSDPHHHDPNFAGYALRSCVHERSPPPAAAPAGGGGPAVHDANTILKVTVLSVSMVKADSVRVAKPVTGEHVDVDPNIMNRFNWSHLSSAGWVVGNGLGLLDLFDQQQRQWLMMTNLERLRLNCIALSCIASSLHVVAAWLQICGFPQLLCLLFPMLRPSPGDLTLPCMLPVGDVVLDMVAFAWEVLQGPLPNASSLHCTP